MLERIVMTKQDCLVFVGTTAQLVSWDMHNRLDTDVCKPNSRASGYLIRSPLPPKGRSWSSTYPFYYWTVAKVSTARPIRILYEDGQLASGARDPMGQHTVLGYTWYTWKTDLKYFREDFKRAVREFCEDVAKGEWENAFRGREEYLQERKKRLDERRRDGQKFTGIEMAILKLFSRYGFD